MRTLSLAVLGLFFVASSASAQKPTDAQIAHIVVTANQIDIDAGKLAASKATNPEVKALGEQLVKDHTVVNKQATDLAARLQPPSATHLRFSVVK